MSPYLNPVDPIHSQLTNRRPNLSRSSTPRAPPYAFEEQQKEAQDSLVDPRDEAVPAKWWVSGFILSGVMCSVIMVAIFEMPWYEPLVAVVLAVFVAVLAIRALG